MEKQRGNAGEKELLKSLEGLVENQDTGKRYAGSFLDFCARLLSIRPKADVEFKLSLEQDLLEKHPAYLAEEADSRLNSPPIVSGKKLRGWAARLSGILLNGNPLKRLAFGSVPVLAIVLALIIAIGNPRVDIARAVEILESDPQISAVIETYGLRVRHVKMWGNLGFILLDRDPYFEDVEVTIVVDLKQETVWKIVADEGGVLSKSEVTGYLDTKEANWAKQKSVWVAEAERQGMSFLEYITHLKKEGAVEFGKRAAAKGMTPDEYRDDLADEKAAEAEAYLAAFAAKAESLGMTPGELKLLKKSVAAFEEKAAAQGMTPDEYMDDLADEAAFAAKAESLDMTPGELRLLLAEEKVASLDPTELKEKAEHLGMTFEEYKAHLVEKWASQEKGL